MNVLIALVALATCAAVALAATDKVVCYYASWATYRLGNGKFDIEDISTDLCTHVIFTFVGLNTDGTILLLDPWNEIDKRALERFANLKSRNPNVKLLMAIGGWNEGSSKYSIVVNNSSLRKKFVDSIVAFVAKYGYDGFDLDWEYPGQRGGAGSDRTAFITLLQELRARFDQNGWLLTAAVAASKSYHATSYDVAKMSQYLDLINIMAYDLHGFLDGRTGQNAPLYASKIDTTASAQLLNVDNVINSWIAAGADPARLTLGMATYGRSFTLASATNNGLGAPTIDSGFGGPYTLERGFLGYNEICEKQKAGGWIKVWDDEQKTPYSYSGNQWVGYDDVKSIEIKTQYAIDKKLGGAMIWTIETDDLRNVCGGGKLPLLSAINNVLKKANNNGEDNFTTQITTSTTTTTTAKPITTTTKTTTAPAVIQTTTTMASQTTQKLNPGALCTRQGYVRDPYNCGIFYYCQPNGVGFKETLFKCPGGLFYDTTSGICNYASLVLC